MTETVILPPPPTKEPIIDKNGKLTPIWWIWFTKMFQRIGGTLDDGGETDAEILAHFADLARNPDVGPQILEGIASFSPEQRKIAEPFVDFLVAEISHQHPISAIYGLQEILDNLSANIDGGSAASVYTVPQVLDGGAA